MKKNLTITPFLPYVTLEQILEYDPARPETHTASPLVNSVCEILFRTPAMQPMTIARCLALDPKHLTCALKVATGLNTSEIRTEWLIHQCRKYMAENPKWRMGDLMKILNLHNHTSMWRFVQANKKHFPEVCEKERRKLERQERNRKIIEQGRLYF